ncbi:hypothetical protein CDD81_7082 [Ophiocordyceps australis]|uniref:Uncharacterized protein n=1 Tax=Ophiocordyceps australis TaxID=1399860 RepID=A0A2C5X972_9HYPO|nr:hypothetical protein CDD81_7082 [Ophiocordyceps australis]
MYARYRSQSRTSNVAERWNECMALTQAENEQYVSEIEQLQLELDQRDQELNKSRTLFAIKGHELEEMKNKLNELREKDSYQSNENKELKDQIDALSQELSSSASKTRALEERYCAYRLKLNDAIREQQDLYKRSKVLHQESMNELQNEKQKRIRGSEAIDKALEHARQKREEMRRCSDELRIQMEYESRVKERKILELQEKIKEQQENMVRERQFSDGLRHQMSTQQRTKEAVTELALKMEVLVERFARSDRHQKDHEKLMNQIYRKLETVTDRWDIISDERGISADNIERVVDAVNEIISPRISTAVSDVSAVQISAMRTLGQVCHAFQSQLGDIRGFIGNQYEILATRQVFDEEAKRNFEDKFHALQGEMQANQAGVEQIKQLLEKQIEADSLFRNEIIKEQQKELDAKWATRFDVIKDLEARVQLMSETQASGIDRLTKQQTMNEEAVQKHLVRLAEELKSSVESGFLVEQGKSEERARQGQASLDALKSQLEAVNHHLTVVQLGANQEANDQEHKNLVDTLEQQILQLENQVKETEQLRNRWLQDIKAIDALRGSLEELELRVPRMEKLSLQLGDFSRINQVMSSTAQYLLREKDWVEEQMEESQLNDSSQFFPSGRNADVPQQAREGRPTFAASSENRAADIVEGLLMDDVPLRRRVKVHSPAGRRLTGSPPPSVEQEQLRRRGAAQPRSILKPKATSLQESGTIEEQASRMPRHRSQYNRPVMGKMSTAAASAEVVEEIRSGLVQPERAHLDWSLPTMMDFEKDRHRASTQNSQGSVENGKRCSRSAPGTEAKRPKVDTNKMKVNMLQMDEDDVDSDTDTA